MDTEKVKRYLTSVPLSVWWIADKLEEHQRKHRARHGADAIDNLERLHKLKEKGVLTEEEFAELKEKLKENIC